MVEPLNFTSGDQIAVMTYPGNGATEPFNPEDSDITLLDASIKRSTITSNAGPSQMNGQSSR
jgi:hypothetical protein